MTQSDWSLFAEILGSDVTAATLPENLESVLAERLEEALAADDRSELDAIKLSLAEFFAALLRRAPADAMAAVQGAASASEASASAFSLGQIAFAQHLAAQAAERRADDRFVAAFEDAKLVPYIKALARADHTNGELMTVVGVRGETVSRRLTELRELGLVDFRRDGTHRYYFLTPQGRAAFEGLVSPEALPHRDPVKVRMVRDRQRSVSETFKAWPTLSNPAVVGH